MKSRSRSPILLLAGWLCLLCCGCKENSESSGLISKPVSPSVPDHSQERVYHLDHALPKLPVVTLWLGPAEIRAEVTRTVTETATGMMFREELNENEGMLFFLGRPRKAGFYMKNVKVPLSCAYISASGEILEIHDMEPMNPTPVESLSNQVLFVLETPRDWFAVNKVQEGMLVRAERGSLLELYGLNRSMW